jgi:hypothetical protein
MIYPLTAADWRTAVFDYVRERGPVRYVSLCSHFDAIGDDNGRSRAIDRALQSLRRAGLIIYDARKGWSFHDT